MYKKTKNVYNELASQINYCLEYNKNYAEKMSQGKIKEGESPIGTFYAEISRGLYNCGADKIFNELCKEMGYTEETAPFYVEVHDNDYYCQIFVRITKKPKCYGED